MYVCIAHTSLRSELRESSGSYYSWKSLFTVTSDRNIAQHRMMLECASSLEDALADNMKVVWLATELEKAGLIMEDQRKSLETSIDADIRAAELISMVTTKVHHSSESFTTFLDVLRKDEATFGHILAKMKRKGMTLYMYNYIHKHTIQHYNLYLSAVVGGGGGGGRTNNKMMKTLILRYIHTLNMC